MEIPLQQHCSKSSHKSNDVFIFVLGRKLNPTHHFAAMGHKKGKLGQMGQSGSKSQNREKKGRNEMIYLTFHSCVQNLGKIGP